MTEQASAGGSAKRVCTIKYYYYDALADREARALLEAGFVVEAICLVLSLEKSPPFESGVRKHFIRLDRTKGSLLRYLLQYVVFFVLVACKLTWLHLRHPYDCIQVNNMPDFLVFATVIPRLLGAKIVLVMYEPTPELWVTKYNVPILIKILELVEQLSLRYAHVVFAVTEQMKQVFVNRGCRADKIHVILNASDERIFGEQIPARAEHDRFILICHGAIEERYGHDTILKAMARVRSQIPGVQLRVLGTGSYVNDFLSQIKELELEDCVEYLGFLPHEAMIAELANADVGIVAQKSSPYSDLVHTGKMYDYFAFGLPVLASHLKAVGAYFDDKSIRFFEPDNAESLAEGIVDLYQHPEKRRSLVENSQALYNQYKWEQQKNIYVSVYRELVG